MRHALVACLALAAAAATHGAQAAMTSWAENEGGRMRIITLPPEPDGTVRGGLQIEPKAGWTTYWKEPGQAGIPPQITVTPPDSATLAHMAFPVPKLFQDGDIRDLGYDHPVTLPFVLTVNRQQPAVQIGASAFIGLCRNICIPFQANFQLPVQDDGQSPAEEIRILQQAVTRLPEAPSTDFQVRSSGLSDDRKLLKLSLKLPQGEKAAQIFVVGPQGHVLIDQANPRETEGLFSVDMPVGKLPAKYDPKGKRWDILVISGERAMETSLAFD
jgi:DsbC/DsbD-like thiol-disulfide interchange protein